MSCGRCERARKFMPAPLARALRGMEARQAERKARNRETKAIRPATIRPVDATIGPKTETGDR